MEESFIYNLEYLIEGGLESISPGQMIEIIVYCQLENIQELLFLTTFYTSTIFDDSEFNFPICDVQVDLFYANTQTLSLL